MPFETVATRLQALVDRTLGRNRHVHAVLLGVARGKDSFRWAGAAGVADPATGAAPEPGTPYLVASVAKLYTAAATMLLVERGRLTLAERITRWFPSGALQGLHVHRGTDHTESLTVRHLLAHTSGLPDYFLAKPRGSRHTAFDRILAEGDREWTLDDVVDYKRRSLAARFAPAVYGTDPDVRPASFPALYSDTNYKLLGAILEAVEDRPFHELLESLFFAPLGLDDTWVYGHPRGARAGALSKVFYRQRVLDVDRLLRTHGPEGGVVSTLDDQLRFGRLLLTGRLFERPTTFAAMQHWNRIFFPIDYGYGLMRFRLSRWMAPFGYTPELIGHSGSSGSFLFHDHVLDLTIAGTVNQMAAPRVPFPLMIRTAQAVQRGVAQPHVAVSGPA